MPCVICAVDAPIAACCCLLLLLLLLLLLQRTVSAIAAEGSPFVGVLYTGFILSPQHGPMVLEYNCRLGDPETQVLLPLLDSDLCHIIRQCVRGRLSPQDVRWADEVACTVVCAAPGYPGTYPKWLPIHGLQEAAQLPGVKVYHAGSVPMAGMAQASPAGGGGSSGSGSGSCCVQRYTFCAHEAAAAEAASIAVAGAKSSGGRVLAVTGRGASLHVAVQRAYSGVEAVSFDGMRHRCDIAKRQAALHILLTY